MAFARREKPLPHFDDRPEGTAIDTLVIHSMYHPSAANKTAPDECINLLDQFKLSAHFFVERSGDVWRMVPEEKRAWHAGVSRMHDGRDAVNRFSIGVELAAVEGDPFTPEQYHSLAALTAELAKRFPIRWIVGHEDIAQPPGRKTDPGPAFEWSKFRSLLGKLTPGSQFEFPFV